MRCAHLFSLRNRVGLLTFLFIEQHFLMSIQLASALPDPSPAPHLYLAQLSATPQESLEHFVNALSILQAKLLVMETTKLGLDGSAGDEAELEDEGEIRRSASRALVGMTELYLTDLWCVLHLFSPSTSSSPLIFLPAASRRMRRRTARSIWRRPSRLTRQIRRRTRCVLSPFCQLSTILTDTLFRPTRLSPLYD